MEHPKAAKHIVELLNRPTPGATPTALLGFGRVFGNKPHLLKLTIIKLLTKQIASVLKSDFLNCM